MNDPVVEQPVIVRPLQTEIEHHVVVRMVLIQELNHILTTHSYPQYRVGIHIQNREQNTYFNRIPVISLQSGRRQTHRDDMLRDIAQIQIELVVVISCAVTIGNIQNIQPETARQSVRTLFVEPDDLTNAPRCIPQCLCGPNT